MWGVGCGVWGFTHFQVVNYLIFREKIPKRLAVSKTENCCYSGLGVDKERKISSGDKRDKPIQGVMDRGQSLTEES